MQAAYFFKMGAATAALDRCRSHWGCPILEAARSISAWLGDTSKVVFGHWAMRGPGAGPAGRVGDMSPPEKASTREVC